MTPKRCRTCATEIADSDALFCSHCGAAMASGEGDPPATIDGQGSRSRNDQRWRLVTWVAVAVGGVAAVALIALTFGTRSEPERTTPDDVAIQDVTTTTVPAPAGEPIKAVETVNLPLSNAVTIEYPRTGTTGRYHLDGEVVNVYIAGDKCGGDEGMIEASGAIRNDSQSRQTLDYIIGVDLIRAVTGSRLAHLETTIEGLAPGASADWSVEMISTRTVSLRCVVTDLTVAPQSIEGSSRG